MFFCHIFFHFVRLVYLLHFHSHWILIFLQLLLCRHKINISSFCFYDCISIKLAMSVSFILCIYIAWRFSVPYSRKTFLSFWCIFTIKFVFCSLLVNISFRIILQYRIIISKYQKKLLKSKFKILLKNKLFYYSK